MPIGNVFKAASHGKAMGIKAQTKSNSDILNILIRRIPNKLLANKDLVFEVSSDEESKDVESEHNFIEVKLKDGSDLTTLASIGVYPDGCDGAHFYPYSLKLGCNENHREKHFYCNKVSYIKEAVFNDMRFCPYVAVCNQVEDFIKKYAKRHKIKLR